MNISAPFIARPVATTLLTAGILLVGVIAFNVLPVSPLPQVDFPTISVSASLPGGSPEITASSIATPLERQFSHIAGVTEMTSSSSLGSTSITLQFDLSRDIDGAARDVEAAINAARTYLPANLPANPTYRKVNPADAPIMILGLTSDKYDRPTLYDEASSVVAQKLSQIEGVGQVTVGGGAGPAVRVEVNPTLLNSHGLTLQNVQSLLTEQNAHEPAGQLSDGFTTEDIVTNDQISHADQYKPLIVGYDHGAAVRLSDVADVSNGAQNIRAAGYLNGTPSITAVIFRQPGANIIETVDRIRADLPSIEASIPQGIKTTIVLDRTTTIRASVNDVESTLVLSVVLVILVVFIFLRNWRATLIPIVAVPVSLIGTFAVMYLFGFSIDNLSLMALTISTGFVVDDAIVVMENISRLREEGIPPMKAALEGSREIGFTILSISISLIAVFIPILLMAGIVGRLFREFAITLSTAIVVSMVISLTTTPMMCAYVLKDEKSAKHGWAYRTSEKGFTWMVSIYSRSLAWVLEHPAPMLILLLLTIGLNIYLIVIIPKGFFPQQDTGRMQGTILGDQDTSFQAMQDILLQMVKLVQADAAVDTVTASTGGSGGGGSTINQGRMNIQLKPLSERKLSVYDVIERLRPRLSRVRGATLYLAANQDVRVGGRQSAALYQFTMRGDNLDDLVKFGRPMLDALKHVRILRDVNSDQQINGLQEIVTYDRDTAARFNISPQLIDNVLYDAYGQRQVSTMYTSLNQYHVVMEVAPKYWQNPDTLKLIYVLAPNGQEVPLNAFTHFAPSTAALSVNHQGLFPAVTISFNLAPGVALGDAVDEIEEAARTVGLPPTIHTTFAGTAQAYQDSLGNEPWLIAAALATVYIVLGVLYESYVHPVTILSTLPSAGVGALLALLLFRTDLSIIAMIGIILLIGIVKKNAIMMIDFALAAERTEGMRPYDAIYQACLLRFRPILMTTMSAMLGALPLALGNGTGSEMRRPLGITIIGGLIVSQLLTLYTTPVVYLELDRLRLRFTRRHRPAGLEPAVSET